MKRDELSIRPETFMNFRIIRLNEISEMKKKHIQKNSIYKKTIENINYGDGKRQRRAGRMSWRDYREARGNFWG